MPRFRFMCFAGALCVAVPAGAQIGFDTAAYRSRGEAALRRLKSEPAPTTNAKNVIIFIGDGMGISTITAGRIFAGQASGGDGESFQTAMDGLPYAALKSGRYPNCLLTCGG